MNPRVSSVSGALSETNTLSEKTSCRLACFTPSGQSSSSRYGSQPSVLPNQGPARRAKVPPRRPRCRRGLWAGYLGGAQRSMGKEIAAVPGEGCSLHPVSGGGYRALERCLIRGGGLPADSRRVRGIL